MFAFCKLKSLLFVGESAAFTWMLLWLGSRRPSFAFLADWTRAFTSTISLGLGVACLCLLAFYSVLRASRAKTRFDVTDQPQYARYMAITQLGAYVGVQLGESAWIRDAAGFGAVLGFTGLVCAIFMVFPYMVSLFLKIPTDSLKVKEKFLWILLFLMISGAGKGIYEGNFSEVTRIWFEIAFYFYLLHLLLLACGGLSWTLRPLETRHIFSKRLPAGARCAAAFMAIITIMPLGGFFLPMFIFIRHRLWPKYEVFLLNEGTNHAERENQ